MEKEQTCAFSWGNNENDVIVKFFYNFIKNPIKKKIIKNWF